MDIDFYAFVTQEFDNLRTRVKALEDALTQLPTVEYEPDPSRLPGVRVAPAPAPSIVEAPNG